MDKIETQCRHNALKYLEQCHIEIFSYKNNIVYIRRTADTLKLADYLSQNGFFVDEKPNHVKIIVYDWNLFASYVFRYNIDHKNENKKLDGKMLEVS